MAKIASRSQALSSVRKPCGVHRVMADQLADLVGELGRMREDVLVGIGRQEAAHGQPVDPRAGYPGGTPTMIDRFPSRARWSQMAGSVIDRDECDPQAAIGVIGPVAEAIDAERAGVLAGRQAHPGGHGDRRDHALQPAVAPTSISRRMLGRSS